MLKCGRIYPELFAASNPNRDSNRASTSIGQWNDSPPKPEQRSENCVFFWLQLKWSPISFGPLTFLVPKKFEPQEIQSPHENHHMGFPYAGTIILEVQIFLGPNFSGTKFWGAQKVTGPNEIVDHFSYSQMRHYWWSILYLFPEIYIPDIGVMLFCRLVLLLFDELFCSRGVSLHSGQLP